MVPLPRSAALMSWGKLAARRDQAADASWRTQDGYKQQGQIRSMIK
jgi:hypothetical protein